MRTITIVGLFLSILMLPLSARTEAPAPPGIPQGVTTEEVRQFMDEYKTRMVKMDLDVFMDLFSKEVIENRVRPYGDMREAYRRTFANSRSLLYDVEIYSIQTYEKNAFVRGRYELTQILGEKKKDRRVFRGDIQWDLIREDRSLKIKEINYGRDLR
jgi:hypothetical protein